MLQEWEIEFRCVQTGDFIGTLAERVHGWLFSVLRQKYANVAELWHAAAVKPFRLTVLSDAPNTSRVTVGDRIVVRIAALTKDAGEWLTDLWMDKPSMNLGSWQWEWGQLHVVRAQTFESLINSAADNATIDYRDFDFQTPTSLRSEGIQIVFPNPAQVFSSLQRRLLRLSAVGFPDLDVDWHRAIVVSRYQLQTQKVSFGQYVIIGFIGQVRYLCRDESMPDVRFLWHLLSDFALYSGIGYKTTMGMGWVQT